MSELFKTTCVRITVSEDIKMLTVSRLTHVLALLVANDECECGAEVHVLLVFHCVQFAHSFLNPLCHSNINARLSSVNQNIL